MAGYEAILAVRPDHPDALNGLGLTLLQRGEAGRAAALIGRAIALAPGHGSAHFNLGLVLMRLGQADAAVACLREAVALLPHRIEAQLALADALGASGRAAEAAEAYRRVLAVVPDHAHAHAGLGSALHDLERANEAIPHLRRAIELKADFADAYISMCIALQTLGRFDEALLFGAKAAQLSPRSARAMLNFGTALQEVGRLDDALAAYARALELEPGLAVAHVNAGIAFDALGRHDDAMARYDRALALEPEIAEARWNKSLSCLMLGRFAEGWPLYEQRWAAKARQIAPRAYPQPSWRGERVAGTLLAWGEQGLGDQIIYAGMLGELTTFADRVVAEVEPRLVPLFQRSFPEVQTVGLGEGLYAGRVDAQVAMGDIGQYLRPSWPSFPVPAQAYLKADPGRTAALRTRLQSGGMVVGLSWCSYNIKRGRWKSARLEEFEALLRLPGFRFVDLQYGDTSEERAALRDMCGATLDRVEDIDNTRDIDGLAALISACDLMVTISNTTAHLAGALGKPTWVLVPDGHVRMWYWFIGRDDSPWYPHVRLRRRMLGESWTALVRSVAEEIAAFARGQAG